MLMGRLDPAGFPQTVDNSSIAMELIQYILQTHGDKTTQPSTDPVKSDWTGSDVGTERARVG